MSLKMTKPEREAFLADLHVGVISIAEKDRGPLTAPIWYGYEPGGELWNRETDLERDERPMAHRYLGRELGDGYIEATRGDGDVDNILVKMWPQRWLTTDYSKQFAVD